MRPSPTVTAALLAAHDYHRGQISLDELDRLISELDYAEAQHVRELLATLHRDPELRRYFLGCMKLQRT